MRRIIILLIKAYRVFVSPVLFSVFGSGCKYSLTCSQYSLSVFKRYGFLKAFNLSLRRFLSCHPFS